ncbi:hypothetical protein Tco_1567764, partial [Tanacetum coccineum]
FSGEIAVQRRWRAVAAGGSGAATDGGVRQLAVVREKLSFVLEGEE